MRRGTRCRSQRRGARELRGDVDSAEVKFDPGSDRAVKAGFVRDRLLSQCELSVGGGGRSMPHSARDLIVARNEHSQRTGQGLHVLKPAPNSQIEQAIWDDVDASTVASATGITYPKQGQPDWPLTTSQLPGPRLLARALATRLLEPVASSSHGPAYRIHGHPRPAAHAEPCRSRQRSVQDAP